MVSTFLSSVIMQKLIWSSADKTNETEVSVELPPLMNVVLWRLQTHNVVFGGLELTHICQILLGASSCAKKCLLRTRSHSPVTPSHLYCFQLTGRRVAFLLFSTQLKLLQVILTSRQQHVDTGSSCVFGLCNYVLLQLVWVRQTISTANSFRFRPT